MSNVLEEHEILMDLSNLFTTAPKPTMREGLKHLKKYQRIKADDDLVVKNETCVICQDEYVVGQYKRQLNCGHVYHKKCIDKWLIKSENMSCPICRESNSPEGEAAQNVNNNQLLSSLLQSFGSLIEQLHQTIDLDDEIEYLEITEV